MNLSSPSAFSNYGMKNDMEEEKKQHKGSWYLEDFFCEENGLHQNVAVISRTCGV